MRMERRHLGIRSGAGGFEARIGIFTVEGFNPAGLTIGKASRIG
jgi:hypothetical protein